MTKDGSQQMNKKFRMIWTGCLLAALLLCLGIRTAGAKTFDSVWRYEELADGTAIITEYGGAAEELIIPGMMGETPVSAIADGVFSLKRKLQSVTIPEGVVSIGTKAFSSCDSLLRVQLPKSLESLGNRAFSNCKGLKSIVLPENETFCL